MQISLSKFVQLKSLESLYNKEASEVLKRIESEDKIQARKTFCYNCSEPRNSLRSMPRKMRTQYRVSPTHMWIGRDGSSMAIPMLANVMAPDAIRMYGSVIRV